MPFRRVRSFLITLLLSSAAALAGCATNPVSGKKQVALMTEAQEIAMGREADQQVRQEMGVYDDRELQQYVERIGLDLAQKSHRPNLPWTFAIVDSPAVNAFALPGGFVYVTRGILPYLANEAELAGVIGHEIGHVTARHSVEQYTRAAGANVGLMIASIFFPATRPFSDFAASGLGMFFLKYSRADELQADRLGAEYAARGGWDPDGVSGMLRTLSRLDVASGSDRKGTPNWLSTHPQPETRVEQVKDAVAQARTQLDGPAVTHDDEFLRRIDGLTFGDDPREGVVRGNLFLHADMRFALEFPDGWDVVNGPEQVVANEPGTKHYLLLDVLRNTNGARSIADLGEKAMRSAGFKLVSPGGETRVNGLDAWFGTYDGRVPDSGDVRARVVIVQHERYVFRLIGFAPRDSFDRVSAEITRSQESFRGLSRDEARDIRPNRLDLYTVREGDTWQSIAQRAGGLIKSSTLAIMNGFPPAEQPRAGDRIKVVVAG